jgi:hypothetical protein
MKEINLFHFRKEDAFKYTSQMSREAPQGFLKMKSTLRSILTAVLQKTNLNKTKIYGMYGKRGRPIFSITSRAVTTNHRKQSKLFQ